MLAIVSSLLALSLRSILVGGLAITPPTEAIPTTTTITLPTAPMTLYSSSPPAPEPEITPGPDPADLGGDGADADAPARFVQTTYWSCVQQPGMATAHCGWHEPIIDASMPSAAARVPGGSAGAAAVAGLAVAFLLLGV